MIYTCSCCKHIEFREWCENYFCEIKKCYMYEGSKQCQHFELKDNLKEDPFYNPNYNKDSDDLNEMRVNDNDR